MTMRRGVVEVRRRRRRAVAFGGVRPTAAGHGAGRRTPPSRRRVTASVQWGALEWAVRSW